MKGINVENVSELIHEKYGIDIQPGKKGECFKCHRKNTFSIKKDNTIGKCFHPACGVVFRNNWDVSTITQKFVERIFAESHELLLTTKCDAYEFLNERRVHQKVISDSMIGLTP